MCQNCYNISFSEETDRSQVHRISRIINKFTSCAISFSFSVLPTLHYKWPIHIILAKLAKKTSQCGNFMIYQSLRFFREINFWDSLRSKYAILTHFEALYLYILNFCTTWRLKFTKLAKFWAQLLQKTAVIYLQDSPKLISRKIWVTNKTEIIFSLKALAKK